MKVPSPPCTREIIRRILSAYNRLTTRSETTSPQVWHDQYRPLLEHVSQAAEDLESDFDIALKNALSMADKATQAAAYRELYGESDAEPDQGLVDTPDWRIRWEILGELTEDTSWRAILQNLRDGKVNLREALKAHPSIGRALKRGVAATGQKKALGPKWLHGLETSARARRITIQAVLNDKALLNPRGPKAKPGIIDFVSKLIELVERLSGTKISSSIYEPPQRGRNALDPVHSPGIEFILVCLKPLYPRATLASVAGYIKTANFRKPDG